MVLDVDVLYFIHNVKNGYFPFVLQVYKQDYSLKFYHLHVTSFFLSSMLVNFSTLTAYDSTYLFQMIAIDFI